MLQNKLVYSKLINKGVNVEPRRTHLITSDFATRWSLTPVIQKKKDFLTRVQLFVETKRELSRAVFVDADLTRFSRQLSTSWTYYHKEQYLTNPLICHLLQRFDKRI